MGTEEQFWLFANAHPVCAVLIVLGVLLFLWAAIRG